MEVNIYNVKVKISKAPEDGIRYANVFQTGVCFCKTNKEAKELVLEKYKEHHEKNKTKDVTVSIIDCKKIKTEFIFQTN